MVWFAIRLKRHPEKDENMKKGLALIATYLIVN